MRSARRQRAIGLLVFVAIAACTAGEPGAGPASLGSSPPATPSSSSPSPTAGSVAPAGDLLRLRPGGGSFLIHGTYPRTPTRCRHPDRSGLTARYPGILLVRRDDDGTISMTVTLPFERYLEGIAEVPWSWPRAALEAQAVAARSYALASTGWNGAEGETLTHPICATTSCQVYRGIPVPFRRGVRRWYAAVRRTSGQVLLSDGQPADTVYFSTSNGRTYGNEDVFGSAPLPYLRPVVERDDGASPTSRWRVRIPFPDLGRFLRAAGDWPAGRRVARVRVRGEVVTVSARGGSATRRLDTGTLRDDVNIWGPCLAPGRYPPPARGGGDLPLTIPSRWSTVAVDGRAIVVRGRGWGHGVGMVQWGAYGKARRGFSTARILAFYYGGLRPTRFPEPGLIHVRVASGLSSLRIRPSSAGATLNGQAIEGSGVRIAGGDRLTITTTP